MKMLKMSGKFTVFHKLILAFFAVILPIYFLCLFINQAGLKYVRNEIINSTTSKVHFYLNSIETEIARLDHLGNIYLVDSDFQNIANASSVMSVYSRSAAILAIKNKLEIYASSSPYVKDIKVFIPSLGRSIFAGSFGETIPEDEIEYLTLRSSSSDIVEWNGTLVLGKKYPRAADLQSLQILLEVELSEKEIKNSLLQMTYIENSGAVLINDKEGWAFSDGKNDAIIPELRSMLPAGVSGDLTGQCRFKSSQDAIQYLMIYEYSQYLNTFLVLYVPESQILQPLNTYNVWLWTISFVVVFVIVIISYWIFIILRKPMKKLVNGLQKVESGDLQVHLSGRNNDEFAFLYDQFNKMVARLNVLIHENYEMELLNKKAQLKQLQSQIDPHFLFNSFLTLSLLARERKMSVILQLTKHLESYFQFVTYNFKDDVTLEDEFGHAVHYAAIQNIRFSNRIRMEADTLPDSMKRLVVPRLIIQPILENAYNHGLKDKKSQGVIRITVREYADRAVIGVEDNGGNMNEEKLAAIQAALDLSWDAAADTTGMMNVHRRLRLKFGEQYGLAVSIGSMDGLLVEINIAKGV